MKFGQKLLSVLVAALLIAQTLSWGVQPEGHSLSNPEPSSKAFEIEKPGLAILNFSGKSHHQQIFFPVFYHEKPAYRFDTDKINDSIKERSFIFPFFKHIICVFIPINAP